MLAIGGVGHKRYLIPPPVTRRKRSARKYTRKPRLPAPSPATATVLPTRTGCMERRTGVDALQPEGGRLVSDAPPIATPVNRKKRQWNARRDQVREMQRELTSVTRRCMVAEKLGERVSRSEAEAKKFRERAAKSSRDLAQEQARRIVLPLQATIQSRQKCHL